MMIKPGINALSSCADSRYTLVTMAAKRARMIGENGEGLVPCDVHKPVSMAVAEIAAGKVGYVRHENKNRKEEQKNYEDFYAAANGEYMVDENGNRVENYVTDEAAFNKELNYETLSDNSDEN